MCSENTVRCIDTRGGDVEKTLSGHDGAITSVASLHSGACVASGSSDCSVRIWKVADGQCIGVGKGHDEEVGSLCCGDNFVASGSDDKTIRVWSVPRAPSPSPPELSDADPGPGQGDVDMTALD